MAAIVVLLALGAILSVSNRCMGMVRSSHNVALGSAAVHERMQQLQAIPWEMLTDSEYYSDQVWTDPETLTTENWTGQLNNSTVAGSQLASYGAVESVTISAYRPVAVASPTPTPITITRNATTATVTSAATTLVDEKMVRIDLRLTWTENRTGRPCSLGASAIVARR